MKLKRKIKIGRKVYKIFKCGNLKRGGEEHSGVVNYQDKEIYLDSKNKDSNELVLNHEIIHALIYEFYLNSKKDKGFYEKLRKKEKFIEALAKILTKHYKLKR